MGIREILDWTVPANWYQYIFLYVRYYYTCVCVCTNMTDGGTDEPVKREVFGALVFH
jgi:hypothetical protein